MPKIKLCDLTVPFMLYKILQVCELIKAPAIYLSGSHVWRRGRYLSSLVMLMSMESKASKWDKYFFLHFFVIFKLMTSFRVHLHMRFRIAFQLEDPNQRPVSFFMTWVRQQCDQIILNLVKPSTKIEPLFNRLTSLASSTKKCWVV